MNPSPGKKQVDYERKPRVPTLNDKPQMAEKSTKDFVKTNAIGNITAIPKKAKPKYTDSPKGTTHLLEESGLLPQYVHKKTYGKVPEYLETRKKEMTEAQLEYERYKCHYHRVVHSACTAALLNLLKGYCF